MKKPDFTKSFRTKDYNIRLVKNKYQFFKISSSQVDGNAYHVLKQEYVGTINSVKGLMRKKLATDRSETPVEYVPGHFILKHVKGSRPA